MSLSSDTMAIRRFSLYHLDSTNLNKPF